MVLPTMVDEGDLRLAGRESARPGAFTGSVRRHRLTDFFWRIQITVAPVS